MQIARLKPHLQQVCDRSSDIFFVSVVTSTRLVAIDAAAHLVHQVIDLVVALAHSTIGSTTPSADDLLDHPPERVRSYSPGVAETNINWA